MPKRTGHLKRRLHRYDFTSYVELELFSRRVFRVTVRLVCELAARHGLCNENVDNNHTCHLGMRIAAAAGLKPVAVQCTTSLS